MICRRQLSLLIAGQAPRKGCTQGRAGETHKDALEPKCKPASCKTSSCLQGVSDRGGLVCPECMYLLSIFQHKKLVNSFPMEKLFRVSLQDEGLLKRGPVEPELDVVVLLERFRKVFVSFTGLWRWHCCFSCLLSFPLGLELAVPLFWYPRHIK